MGGKTKEERAAYARKYYHERMTKEQKRRKRKLKAEWSRTDKGRKTTKEWKDLNRDKVCANNIQQATKARHPEIFAKSSLSNADVRKWVSDRWEQPCRYCGQPSTSVDHVLPLSRGGEHEVHNFELICITCNIVKRDKTPEEFYDWLKLVMHRMNNAEEITPPQMILGE